MVSKESCTFANANKKHKNNKEIMEISELILLHMRLHFTTDKAAEKLKKSIGDEQFFCLTILNEADKICN